MTYAEFGLTRNALEHAMGLRTPHNRGLHIIPVMYTCT